MGEILPNLLLIIGFEGGLVIKYLPAKQEALIPGSGRSPGEGNGKYSCLGNPIHCGAWGAIYSPWGRRRVRYNLETK